MRRTAALVAALGAAMLAPPAAPAASHCLTPVASDRHEPVCNPYLSQSSWAASHRGSYAQGSSPYPAPAPGQSVGYQRILFPGSPQIPVIIQFSDPYADRGRAVWWSVVSSPDVQGVYKADFRTGRVIDSVTAPAGAQPTPVGVYNLLDRDGRFVVTRKHGLDVFGDSRRGDRFSQIRLVKRFELPSSALCGDEDQVIGLTMTFDGRLAFVTERGMVGVVPDRPEQMTASRLRVLSLSGGRCGADTVSNSIAADEDGGIYVVTSKAMYRVQWSRGGLRVGWRSRYETGSGVSGVRIGEGSGSTPDVMGTHRGDDKLAVITDGQKLMHLVLFWRDRIPRGWKPIAPGKDRRIACEVPVNFGDSSATETNSEQSVLTRGYASVISNNQLKNQEAIDALPVSPRQKQTIAALAGQDPANAPYGLERIDWDPKSRRCKRVWVNRDVSLPNDVPTMSTASNLVYGLGQRNGVWGLEGVDFRTGRSALRIDASAAANDNSFYAAATVGPDNSLWHGTGNGVHIWRGPARPAPRLECRDLERPSVRIRRSLRVRRRSFALRGRASDRACGRAARPRRVLVSVARRSGGRCRFLSPRKRFGHRVSCRRTRFLRARGTRRWRFSRRARLRPGRYLVAVTAVDRGGNRSRQARLRVRVKAR